MTLDDGARDHLTAVPSPSREGKNKRARSLGRLLVGRDVLAGLMFIAVAALGLWLSQDMRVGTVEQSDAQEYLRESQIESTGYDTPVTLLEALERRGAPVGEREAVAGAPVLVSVAAIFSPICPDLPTPTTTTPPPTLTGTAPAPPAAHPVDALPPAIPPVILR